MKGVSLLENKKAHSAITAATGLKKFFVCQIPMVILTTSATLSSGEAKALRYKNP